MASATETQQPIAVDSQITAADAQVNPTEQYAQVNDQKDGDDAKKPETDIEVASVDDETGKAYYSKKSVWLMILFSGLAIGSDG
jgi:hypothetical protein